MFLRNGLIIPNQVLKMVTPMNATDKCHCKVFPGRVSDDLKLPDDDGGEIPKFQGRGWRFESRLWNLLSTWWKTCQVVNCLLLCFDVGPSTFCLQKKKRKKRKILVNHLFWSQIVNYMWDLSGCWQAIIRPETFVYNLQTRWCKSCPRLTAFWCQITLSTWKLSGSQAM